MKKLIIEGNHELSGTIKIGGAKNSVVALIPAAMLTDGKCVIYNVPNISDVPRLISMMEALGSKIEFKDETLYIDNTNSKNAEIDEENATKLRASYYFMGVLLAKYGYAEISYPGGCSIGSRPINFHLNGFEKLGAKISVVENKKYIASAKELVGSDIFLDFASVGATLNLMFAAVKAKGITNIYNAAKEPEIVNVASFLATMGAKVYGAGTSHITIEGATKLGDGIVEVIPDRIEAGTYLMIGSLLGKNLVIEGVLKDHLEAVFTKLKEAGCDINIDGTTVIVNKVDHLKPVNVKTLVYPGFPTDLGQPMSTLLTQCEGESLFEETIYENRMRHIKYLNAMGANIRLFDRSAIIAGKSNLIGREVEATDLRAGAAMLVAGMIAEGTTKIVNIEHILRGYEKIVEKLSTVGAKIELVDE
ncbi:MAG: UDP-N-acetylglucosamine 1-carboxyvinyltransferase [Tenericutes bacterium]|nr:UDP-N-acetylglucosamine 1-carboxyvinyltransferase [Mycoplasmatota bacterium]